MCRKWMDEKVGRVVRKGEAEGVNLFRNLWFLLSNHSDRQEGVGQQIKIIFSYDSHISLADGGHVFPHAKDVICDK